MANDGKVLPKPNKIYGFDILWLVAFFDGIFIIVY